MRKLQNHKQINVAELLRTTFLVFPIVLAFLANAQGQQTQPPGQSNETRFYDLEIVNGSIVRVGSTSDKREATLGNVIDAVRQRYPDANIAMSPGLSRLKISDLKLRTRSIWEDLEAIRVASGGKFDWSGPGFNVVGRPGFEPDPSAMAKGNGLFTLREAVTAERERAVEAFNIGPYLQHEDVEEIGGTGKPTSGEKPKTDPASRDKRLAEVEQIILETIGALHDEEVEKPRFQFHRGANLLIVIGSREAVEVARKIVGALPGQGNMPVAQETMAPVKTSPEATEAFRRRYGLSLGPQAPQFQAEQQEAFRKRYGLDRAPTPGQPPQGLPAPASKPQQ